MKRYSPFAASSKAQVSRAPVTARTARKRLAAHPAVDGEGGARGVEPGDGRAAVHLAEPGGVPQLGAEVAIAFDALFGELDVPRLAGHGDQGEAQGVGAVFVDQLQGVHDIALGLGHLGPFGVPDQGVDEHPGEGNLAGEMQAHHHHPGDPEEDDVKPGDQGVRRIEPLQVRGPFRPTQGGERPQGGGRTRCRARPRS